jgi:hypothetical protein
MLETYLAEVKHKGEPKCWHSEPTSSWKASPVKPPYVVGSPPSPHNIDPQSHRSVPSGSSPLRPTGPQLLMNLLDLCSIMPLPCRPSPHSTGPQDLSLPGPIPAGLTGPALQACHIAAPQGPHTAGLPVHCSARSSSCKPASPRLPTAHHSRAPNLPRRHRQTGLDAKRGTPELLRLKFYCSRTGCFFFSFL